MTLILLLRTVQITAAPPMPMGPPGGGNRGFGQPQFGGQQR